MEMSQYEEFKTEQARIIREALLAFAATTLGRERAEAESLAAQAEEMVEAAQ
jgi:hypothetical protein